MLQINYVFAYVRLTQHTYKYINPTYMYVLKDGHMQIHN
jgi:hypothetical protein